MLILRGPSWFYFPSLHYLVQLIDRRSDLGRTTWIHSRCCLNLHCRRRLSFKSVLRILARCLPASPFTSCHCLHPSLLLPHPAQLEQWLLHSSTPTKTPHFAVKQNRHLICDPQLVVWREKRELITMRQIKENQVLLFISNKATLMAFSLAAWLDDCPCC